jgi:hypothetical protein
MQVSVDLREWAEVRDIVFVCLKNKHG